MCCYMYDVDLFFSRDETIASSFYLLKLKQPFGKTIEFRDPEKYLGMF